MAFVPRAFAALDGNPLYVLVNGRSAVIFFFVLSGYVLTHRFYQTHDATILARGALKRLPRLAGTTTVITLISCALFLTGAYHFADAASINQSYWLKTSGYADLPANFHGRFLEAFWQGSVFTFLRGDDSYNTNLWTMNIEFLGSMLVFGLALPLVNGFGPSRWLLGAGVAALSVVFLQPMLLPFICGTTIAYVHSLRTPQLGPKTKWALAAVAFLLFSYNYKGSNFLFDFARPADPTARNLYNLFLPTCGALILIHVVACKVRYRVANGLDRVGRWLGAASFSLYLCHTLVIWSLSSWMFTQLRPNHGIVLTLALIFPPTVIVVILASGMLTLFDQHWTRLVNRAMDIFWKKTNTTCGKRLAD